MGRSVGARLRPSPTTPWQVADGRARSYDLVGQDCQPLPICWFRCSQNVQSEPMSQSLHSWLGTHHSVCLVHNGRTFVFTTIVWPKSGRVRWSLGQLDKAAKQGRMTKHAEQQTGKWKHNKLLA